MAIFIATVHNDGQAGRVFHAGGMDKALFPDPIPNKVIRLFLGHCVRGGTGEYALSPHKELPAQVFQALHDHLALIWGKPKFTDVYAYLGEIWPYVLFNLEYHVRGGSTSIRLMQGDRDVEYAVSCQVMDSVIVCRVE